MNGTHVCAVSLLERPVPANVLVVAAHPDDETIGAGQTLVALARAGHRPQILHVTDGAPRDPALRGSLRDRSPEDAAAVRRAEVRAALRVSGIDDRVTLLPSLGVADQEAARSLVRVTLDLARRMAGLHTDVVVTHPYEGGHPDHDAVAFAVHGAVALLQDRGAPVGLAEMTSYHAAGGALVTGSFLEGRSPRGGCGRSRVLALDGEARANKARMMRAFASQAEILAPFGVDEERLRCAPDYDFTSPPHDGPLHYERLPFGWTGERWRELARAALRELDLGER